MYTQLIGHKCPSDVLWTGPKCSQLRKVTDKHGTQHKIETLINHGARQMYVVIHLCITGERRYM